MEYNPSVSCSGSEDFDVNTAFDYEWHSSLIWMQFTNLKDKNGKEIYEGDIVSLTQGFAPRQLFQVEFDVDDGRWMYTHKWKMNPEIKDQYQISSTGFHGDARTNEEREVEVVGNIYENPELLK